MSSGCCVNRVHMKAACKVLSSPITDTHTHTHTRDGYGVRSPSAYWAWQISPQVPERRERDRFCFASEAVPQGMRQPPQPPSPLILQPNNFSSPTPFILKPTPMHQQTSTPSDASQFTCNGLQPGTTTEWFNVKDLGEPCAEFTIRDSWHTRWSYHKWCGWEPQSFENYDKVSRKASCII